MKRVLTISTMKARKRLPEHLRAAGIIKQAHVNGGQYFGDSLTEINVTSPTCFREITDQTGFDVPAMFMTALERRLAD